LAKLKLLEKKYLSVRAFIQRFNLVAAHTSESLWISIQAERELQDENAVKELSLSLENGFPDSKETKLLKDFKIGS